MLEQFVNTALDQEAILSAIPEVIYIILCIFALLSLAYSAVLLVKYSSTIQPLSSDNLQAILTNNALNHPFFTRKPYLHSVVSKLSASMQKTNHLSTTNIECLTAAALQPLNRIGKSLSFIQIAAPLFGLSGTIIGLKVMFAAGDIDNSAAYLAATAIALNTTFFGAVIAILTALIQTKIHAPRLEAAFYELNSLEAQLRDLQTSVATDMGDKLVDLQTSAKEYYASMSQMLLKTITTSENIARQFDKINQNFDKQAQLMTSYHNFLAKLDNRILRLENRHLNHPSKPIPVPISQALSEQEEQL